MKKLFPWIFIVIIALCVATLPLFGKAYIPTHDGEYHIIRIVEFARMVAQGEFVPRWAPTLNSGYGIPIFEFHYPFPNYIGSFLRIFTHDAVYAFQSGLAVGYIIAGIFAFLWLATIVGPLFAFMGAVVGAFVPYWFVDIYVRGTIGEVWAIAWLFLCFYAIERKKIILFSVSMALLVISHNILGMLFVPICLLYGLWKQKTILPFFLGLGLSAWFWIPALFEKQYVVGLNTVNFKEHFVAFYELFIPSWGTAFSSTGFSGNKISFQIGIIPIIVIMGSLLYVIRNRRKGNDIRAIFSFVIAFLSIIFMLPISTIAWKIVSPLQLMQYPWRLLSFFIPIVSYLTAYWMSKIKKPVIGILLVCLAIVFTLPYTRKVIYAPRNEAYYLSRSNFTDGTSSMGNSFSTIWTSWKEQKPAATIMIQNGRVVHQGLWKYMDKRFQIAMDADGFITLPTLYFPGWTVTIDGKRAPILYQSEGIISVSAPKGEHNIIIRYLETPVRLVADIISVFCLVGIIGWGILAIYERSYRHLPHHKRP